MHLLHTRLSALITAIYLLFAHLNLQMNRPHWLIESYRREWRLVVICQATMIYRKHTIRIENERCESDWNCTDRQTDEINLPGIWMTMPPTIIIIFIFYCLIILPIFSCYPSPSPPRCPNVSLSTQIISFFSFRSTTQSTQLSGLMYGSLIKL